MSPCGYGDGARRPCATAVGGLFLAALGVGIAIPRNATAGVVDVSLDLAVELEEQTVEPGEVVRIGETVVHQFYDGPEGVELSAWLEVWTPLEGTGGYGLWRDNPLFSPGTAFRKSGTTVSTRDLATLDPDTEDVEVAWSGEAAGVPRGAAIDAVAQVGEDWLLSFDVSIELGAIRADDEDIVVWNALDGWVGVMDMGAAGVPAELDLDGLEAHGFERLWMSFDGSGEIEGLYFDDDDVLLLHDGVWSLALDGGIDLALASGVDLDALGVPPMIFTDGFETGNTARWSSAVP
jgi:hypothetical protein